MKKVRCVDCRTIYWIPRNQKRLKSFEVCPNDECCGKHFRRVNKRLREESSK
jgi:hypothetical protein